MGLGLVKDGALHLPLHTCSCVGAAPCLFIAGACLQQRPCSCPHWQVYLCVAVMRTCRWKEERRKHYPTAANQAKRAAEAKSREEAGGRLCTTLLRLRAVYPRSSCGGRWGVL